MAIFISEIKSVKNSLPKQETSGPDDFTGEFYQLKRNDINSLRCLSKKLKYRESFPTRFMRPVLPYYQNKKQKYYKKEKLQMHIYHEHRYKNPQIILTNRIK